MLSAFPVEISDLVSLGGVYLMMGRVRMVLSPDPAHPTSSNRVMMTVRHAGVHNATLDTTHDILQVLETPRQMAEIAVIVFTSSLF